MQGVASCQLEWEGSTVDMIQEPANVINIF